MPVPTSTLTCDKNDLPQVMMDVVVAYYQLDFEPFLSCLSHSCFWIDPNHTTHRGIEAIRSAFAEGASMPPFELYDLAFESIDDTPPDMAIIMGDYLCLSDTSAQAITAASQHLTAVWKRGESTGAWSIIHLHVSNKWSEAIEGEAFPLQVSQQTWRYAQALVEQQVNHKPDMLSIKTEPGATLLIDPQSILYLEAHAKRCIMHTVDASHVLACSLGDIEPKLPATFKRVHRSYIVNMHHAARLDTENIALSNGALIPIPKRKRAQIQRLFEEK